MKWPVSSEEEQRRKRIRYPVSSRYVTSVCPVFNVSISIAITISYGWIVFSILLWSCYDYHGFSLKASVRWVYFCTQPHTVTVHRFVLSGAACGARIWSRRLCFPRGLLQERRELFWRQHPDQTGRLPAMCFSDGWVYDVGVAVSFESIVYDWFTFLADSPTVLLSWRLTSHFGIFQVCPAFSFLPYFMQATPWLLASSAPAWWDCSSSFFLSTLTLRISMQISVVYCHCVFFDFWLLACWH